MFDDMASIRWAQERARRLEAFESLKLSDLTVGEFRQLMAQVAFDATHAHQPSRPQLTLGEWRTLQEGSVPAETKEPPPTAA